MFAGECGVSKELSYDKSADTLYEPTNNIQCAMLRGIVGVWTQLIYYDFYSQIIRGILFNLTEKKKQVA